MIGDVLTSSILFEVIKKHMPNAELHYLINTHTYPVVKAHPFIDAFHFFTPEHDQSTVKVFKLAKALQENNFDTVIDVYSKLSSNLICHVLNAKLKVSKYKWYSAFIYDDTHKYKEIPSSNAGLAIENRLQLLESLGIKTPEIVKPKIYLTNTEKQDAKVYLESNGIHLEKPLIMIGVLGSSHNKTYPFKYMAKVIDFINETLPESQILFNYIPKQEDDAKAIFNLCEPKTQKAIHFAVFGKSLREFIAITSHCNALIGNEGGAVNMAKAIDISTFTFFSPWIKKEDWNMFDDGKNHISVHLKDYLPNVFDNKTTKQLKPEALELYQEFKPHYFENQLKHYLQNL